MLPLAVCVCVCVCVCVSAQGHVFSSASQLIGLELSEEFVKLQNDIMQKYKLTDRIKVQSVHTEYTQSTHRVHTVQ